MKIVKSLTVLAAALFIFSSASYAAVYKIDHDHSTVGFKIRHLLSYTQGKFDDFEGTFDYDPAKPENSKVEATVKADSIDTNVKPRDKHLKSKDFFDVDQFAFHFHGRTFLVGALTALAFELRR